MIEPLDETAVETLAGDFLRAIHAHYLRRPISRASAQEVLNALASVTAYIIGGTGDPDNAAAFFNLAFKMQMAETDDQHHH